MTRPNAAKLAGGGAPRVSLSAECRWCGPSFSDSISTPKPQDPHGAWYRCKGQTGYRLEAPEVAIHTHTFHLSIPVEVQSSPRRYTDYSGERSACAASIRQVQASIRREVIREACSLATPPAHLVAETPRRQATALRGAVEAEHATRGQRRWQRRPSTTLPHG